MSTKFVKQQWQYLSSLRVGNHGMYRALVASCRKAYHEEYIRRATKPDPSRMRLCRKEQWCIEGSRDRGPFTRVVAQLYRKVQR